MYIITPFSLHNFYESRNKSFLRQRKDASRIFSQFPPPPLEVLCSKSLYVRIYGPSRKIISATLICVTGVYKSVNKHSHRIWIWNERKNGGNNHLATEKVQENAYPCNWEIYEIRVKQKRDVRFSSGIDQPFIHSFILRHHLNERI